MIGVVAVATYQQGGSFGMLAQAKDSPNLPPRTRIFLNAIIRASRNHIETAGVLHAPDADCVGPRSEQFRRCEESHFRTDGMRENRMRAYGSAVPGASGSFAAREMRAEQPLAAPPPVIPEQQRYRQDFNTATLRSCRGESFPAPRRAIRSRRFRSMSTRLRTRTSDASSTRVRCHQKTRCGWRK